jgi:K(+)-stimulated pyrophosphate-energized sodium pump
VQLLVWIFVMRVMMIVASGLSYFINDAIAKSRYRNADSMNFESPLTSLVWITSIVSVVITFIVSKLTIPTLSGNPTLWWKLAIIISCGTIAGALIPELVKVFTSTESRHVSEVGHVFKRRRGFVEYSLRPGCGQFFGLLARHKHRRPDGNRILFHEPWS